MYEIFDEYRNFVEDKEQNGEDINIINNFEEFKKVKIE